MATAITTGRNAMPDKWKEKHTAFLWINRYEICFESGLYVCHVKRREPIDCYSSTLVDNLYEIGRSDALADAKAICIKHAADAKAKSDAEAAE
jgi:hypothetical protein